MRAQASPESARTWSSTEPVAATRGAPTNASTASSYRCACRAPRRGPDRLDAAALVGRDAAAEERRVDAEPLREPLDRLGGRARLAALDLADVLLREALAGELRLRHPRSEAERAKALAERDAGCDDVVAPSSPPRERLRSLRLAAGLTQSQLAGERFSKEYVSQIERGKTRPTPESIAWLAAQLGVDRGVPRQRGLHRPARPDRGAARARRGDDGGTPVRRGGRALRGGATRHRSDRLRRARGARALRRGVGPLQEGDAREAVDLLHVARELAEGPQFSDVDRADLLFRLGVCRYKLSSIATAVALFDEAFALARLSGLPCDLLRADILGWRSRCRRRQRDFEAAREDVERALELAQAMDDRRVVANTYFQASLVAERMGHWVAVAQLRAAGQGAVPGAERRAERRPPDAEPGRAHLSSASPSRRSTI